jgi:60 kDa SS-A/Ro ribonucleoprotein
MVPTQFLKSPLVWEALLEKMPITAMIRNLGNMGACGLLKPMSEASSSIIGKITHESIEKSLIHPINILYAAKTYAQGHGVKGDNTWPVDGNIVDVLDDAFYLAFKNVKATGKRFLVGIDVSGSMEGFNSYYSGSKILTPREIAAAMSVIHIRTEPQVHYMAFSSGFIPLPITKKSTISSAIGQTSGLPFERTDCALPMLYALKNKLPVDAFIVYTDNETWHGTIHPFQALKKYREVMGINAKLVVCGVTATDFSIADSNDPGMLDIVGFDSAIPMLVNDFVSNN